jgi:hypothetical protein
MNGAHPIKGQRPSWHSVLRDVSSSTYRFITIPLAQRARGQSAAVSRVAIQGIEQWRSQHRVENRKAQGIQIERDVKARHDGTSRDRPRHSNASGRPQSVLAVRADLDADRLLRRQTRRLGDQGRADQLAPARHFERTAGGSTCTAGSSISANFDAGARPLNRGRFSQGIFRVFIEPWAVCFLYLCQVVGLFVQGPGVAEAVKASPR